MIELFEQDIKTNDRQSSKGNQLKWEKNNIWYKADYTGYEGLSEYIISNLLKYSDLSSFKYVTYTPISIGYKNKKFLGAMSKSFLKDDWQIITIERLFKMYHNKSLHTAIWEITDPKERLAFIVDEIKKLTGLKDFGKYLNIVLTIDALFLNEDRHTHNIAVLMNRDGEFDYCPIFDNGAGLLSDTTMDYPLEEDIYKLIDTVCGKTFSTSLEEQLNVSEVLYGQNISFKFTEKDVIDLLGIERNDDSLLYDIDLRKRVYKIIMEQRRKYKYLFE